MNLVQEYGGYYKAKAASKRIDIRSIGYKKLKAALLQYRRKHNMYDVDDLVVYLSNIAPEHNDIYRVQSVTPSACYVVDDSGMDYYVPFYHIKHATNEEIKAQRRLSGEPKWGRAVELEIENNKQRRLDVITLEFNKMVFEMRGDKHIGVTFIAEIIHEGRIYGGSSPYGYDSAILHMIERISKENGGQSVVVRRDQSIRTMHDFAVSAVHEKAQRELVNAMPDLGGKTIVIESTPSGESALYKAFKDHDGVVVTWDEGRDITNELNGDKQ